MMSRLFPRVTLAFVLVLVWAGLLSLARGAGPRANEAEHELARVVVAQGAASSQSSLSISRRDGEVRRLIERKTESPALSEDDNDDPDGDIAFERASSECLVTTSDRAEPPRIEGQLDTSCFEASVGLPRGPPV